MMNYIITNHAKQRRPHYPIRSEEELIEIMKRLDFLYKFSSLKNGKYYFRKGGKAAVIKKDGNTITLITIRGIDLETEINSETLPALKIEDPVSAERRRQRNCDRSIKNTWMQNYPAVFEETQDGGYSVFFPDVNGCISAGKNLEEAITMAKKAIAVHLSLMIEDGDSIPVIDLNRCKEIAKGCILVMIIPKKDLLIVSRSNQGKIT